MKIYTRVEHRWNGKRYEVASAEWFEYTGPVSLCGPEAAAAEPVAAEAGAKGAADTAAATAGGGEVGSGYAASAPGWEAATAGGGEVGSGYAASAPGSTPGLFDTAKEGVTKVLGDPLGRAAAQTGLQMGMGAIQGKQADAFNSQLKGLIDSANSKTYSAAQAVPLAPKTPGLSGSSGGTTPPAATVASMNLPAPIAPTSNIAGTQNAPASPSGAQTGAIKLGARPMSYA